MLVAAMSRSTVILVAIAGASACGTRAPTPGADLQIVGESTRIRSGDPGTAMSPWFDGKTVMLVAARNEMLGIQIVHRGGGPVDLAIPEALVRGFAVTSLVVRRGSTSMYGGSHGEGSYPEELVPSLAPTTDPAYFEIASDTVGTHTGTLAVAGRTIPVTLTIVDVKLPPLTPTVWAYEDPRELAWAAGSPATGSPAAPAGLDVGERACIAMFREHGVLLTPDLALDSWEERKAQFAGMRYIPVTIGEDPATIGDAVRGWIAATRGTGQVPFAIPIDEPRDAAARTKVRGLADLVRAAGGGPDAFVFAVTDAPHPEYGDAIDLYISARAAHLTGDHHARWTYNGTPPGAGSMVLDAETPGTRTWGWIAWRYQIPIWYVWDALYWHDRHNAKRQKRALPGRALEPRRDATSFDDGEDHGNLDGVLALPGQNGCHRTLRLAALRRGLQDRALLELAATCAPDATAKLAAELVPRALGDAPADGKPAWPTDEAAWERARRRLLELAACAR